MRRTTLKAPFGWVGGKALLAKEIIPLMPEHTRYVEVFGGALSVFYQKEPSKIEVVNDINSDLINLHRIIRNRPASLQAEMNSLFKSRELFLDIKNGKLKPKNDIQKAAFYFYLLATSFGAKGDNFAIGNSKSAKNIHRDFFANSKRLKRAFIENMSYEKLIKGYDSSDTLFYVDPPYVGAENYYKMVRGFGINEHENLAKILANVKGKFMLSYNDCEMVRSLYKDFKFKELKVNYSLNSKYRSVKNELLIMNF
ncbi:DNA adenine methylase [Campylobacter fetus]|uniref:DNA adenine methylase n=3 Tax=Campylobacter fetus TaxID=196 RepID=UPI0001BCE590|nr:DNA adenine methylase [Campylobacter fetus]AHE95227.1 DNA adenine methylase [Campylobacter fetus subsp. venerealis cfvi03/293]KAA3683056.1 DNA adenine methylase [Campylobacter fetus subsp. fetus]KAA3684194.1 DNA adenine methylase [Campylobacter fetus subsp. fetus]MBC3781224.1 DNA adenine methylase [Campylobacter fetus subsp. fetus]MBC3781765.1 DNA adenine methylase [Campylobacter fetus subsp. venerealis]